MITDLLNESMNELRAGMLAHAHHFTQISVNLSQNIQQREVFAPNESIINEVVETIIPNQLELFLILHPMYSFTLDLLPDQCLIYYNTICITITIHLIHTCACLK